MSTTCRWAATRGKRYGSWMGFRAVNCALATGRRACRQSGNRPKRGYLRKVTRFLLPTVLRTAFDNRGSDFRWKCSRRRRLRIHKSLRSLHSQGRRIALLLADRGRSCQQAPGRMENRDRPKVSDLRQADRNCRCPCTPGNASAHSMCGSIAPFDSDPVMIRYCRVFEKYWVKNLRSTGFSLTPNSKMTRNSLAYKYTSFGIASNGQAYRRGCMRLRRELNLSSVQFTQGTAYRRKRRRPTYHINCSKFTRIVRINAVIFQTA